MIIIICTLVPAVQIKLVVLTTEWLGCRAAREMVVMRSPLTLIADYEKLIA